MHWFLVYLYELRKLQRVLNAAARLLTLTKKFDHISPVLKQLQWLPIKELVHYTKLVIPFKGLGACSCAKLHH